MTEDEVYGIDEEQLAKPVGGNKIKKNGKDKGP
jgi:hypothetical protein